jgi:hypothetical protein
MKYLTRCVFVVVVTAITWCVGAVCYLDRFGLPLFRIAKNRFTGTEIHYQVLIGDLLIAALLTLILKARSNPSPWTRLALLAVGIAMVCSTPLLFAHYYVDYFR